MVDYVFLKIF